MEVGTAPGSVAVRDTVNRDGAVLTFSTQTWQSFATSIKEA